MAETLTKRRREKYSKLICLGCRARRIRCVLPDSSIEPSNTPQSRDKACQRCQQNGLDCIVDYTTLGRPAQKRNRVDQAPSQQQSTEQSNANEQMEDFEETISRDVDDFLLSRPEGAGVDAAEQKPPNKHELFEAMLNPFHLMSALLSRDKDFASAIGSQPMVTTSVLTLVDESSTVLLDKHLGWFKLYFPEIPALPQLREEIRTFSPGHQERRAGQFLLTLLYDLALDVPSAELAELRQIQPAVRALLYHDGQKLLFSLARSKHTVLALLLTAQYRPLALTSSQVAGAEALKAIPHVVFAKYVATELGYPKAGSKLLEALHTFSADATELWVLMCQCLQWIRLSISEEAQSGAFIEWSQNTDPNMAECLEALRMALLLGRMPVEILLAYSQLSGLAQLLTTLGAMCGQWRDLEKLGAGNTAHQAFCETERQTLEHTLDQQLGHEHSEISSIISHLAEMDRHLWHTTIKGASMFFAVMFGAFASTSEAKIQAEQAVQIGDNIINQLLAHDESDPTRPSHRKFLETWGVNHIDHHEKTLTNFITAADTLTLAGIPLIGPSRSLASTILSTCKSIVEEQAARLKGWGGLHDRVDVHMILFHECARRLEGMSASAGTQEAMAKGCILTATAKLVRSLHRILQGFKRTVTVSQRRSTSESSKQDPTPPEVPNEEESTFIEVMPTVTDEWDPILSDDLFADWDNWPQFEAFDFSDLFGDFFDVSPELQ